MPTMSPPTKTMKLFPIRYTKADLAHVPEEEHLTFVMVCQLGNDITILKKLLQFASNFQVEVEVIHHGHVATANLLVRLLAGRLYEGWNTYQARLTRLWPQYEMDLPEDAKKAWTETKAYFSRENLIKRMRNKVGFHADPIVARAGYMALPADEALVDYLAEQQTNMLYYSAELPTAVAMAHLTGAPDFGTGLGLVYDEVIEVASRFDAVINGFAEIFIQRHIVANKAPEINPIVIEGLPRIGQVSLGFFVDVPNKGG